MTQNPKKRDLHQEEYNSEPVPGLPGYLPEGEQMLWQGAPDWRSLAWRAYHLGHVCFYFVMLLAWSTVSDAMDHKPVVDIALGVGKLLALGGAAIGLLAVVAWLTGRTTLYTITSRRVVLRIGIALPIMFNLPYRMVTTAGLKIHADGTGDIPLGLKPGQRLAWLILWPHVRPWRLARSEPMLRGVPEAARVAQILARAMALANDQPAPAAPALAGVPHGADQQSAPAAA
jgi:hypothetical protein